MLHIMLIEASEKRLRNLELEGLKSKQTEENVEN